MSEETKTVPTNVEAEAALTLWWLAASGDRGRMAASWFEGSAVDMLEGQGLVRRRPMYPNSLSTTLIAVELTGSGRQRLNDLGSRADLFSELSELSMLTLTLISAIREMPESVRSSILTHVKIMAAQVGKITVVAARAATAAAGERAGPGGAL